MHGSLQADRLGQHLATSGPKLSHLFSSDLQRAYKTAEALREAQFVKLNSVSKPALVPMVTRLPLLREQDFGFYEGMPFGARSRESKTVEGDDYMQTHQMNPSFKDPESQEAMALRINMFLDEHFLPLFKGDSPFEYAIAIVSHGIILSTLWRCLLNRFAAQTVSLAPETSLSGGGVTLENLGSWSNTGYLELDILPPSPLVKEFGARIPILKVSRPHPLVDPDVYPSTIRCHMIVRKVNEKEHLNGLKRTGGGVGSSKHDDSQKKIETFFKKQ